MSGLRVAVAGCGPRGIVHGDAAASVDGLELIGVADTDRARADEAGRTLGAPAHGSVAELVAATEPEVVVVATPATGRAALIEELLDGSALRGLLVEKPLALKLGEAEAIVEACERCEVTLAVGHQTRFSVPFARLRETIISGELGEVEFVRAVGYGNLLDQGNHVIDTLRWLLGDEVAWVMSQAERDLETIGELMPADLEPWSDPAHPAPMWMTHQLAFEGGTRAAVETGLLYQRSEPFVDDWLQRRVAIMGSEGFAEARISGGFRSLSRSGGERTAPDDFDEPGESTRALHADLRDAVTAGRTPASDGRDALRTLAAVLACLRSADEGRLVRPGASP